MSVLPQHPKHCHCCSTEGQRVTWNNIGEQIMRRFSTFQTKQNAPSSTPGSSTASKRYTPAGSTQTMSSSSPAQAPNSGDSKKQSSSAGNASPQVQSQTPSASTNADASAAQRILFGVQGSRWSLDLEQIHVSSIGNDPAFFRELKVRYRKHRSWAKRIASPFRFRFCKFVKVCKTDSVNQAQNLNRIV
jgi:hypothetical protein